MSSETVLLALAAGYVGIVVLWCLAVSRSLYALAVLRARLRDRWPHWKDQVVPVLDRSRATAAVVTRGAPRSRPYLTGALAAAAVAGLTALAVAGMRDFGSKRKAGPTAAHEQQPADRAPLHPSRPLVRPNAAHSQPSGSARAGKQQSHLRVQRAPDRPTKVVSVVRVSARVTSAPPATPSPPVAHSDGPAPLPAPAASSAPSPLAAP